MDANKALRLYCSKVRASGVQVDYSLNALLVRFWTEFCYMTVSPYGFHWRAVFIIFRRVPLSEQEQFLGNVSGSINRAPTQRSTGMLRADKPQTGGRNCRAVTPEIYARVDPDTEFAIRPEVVDQPTAPDQDGIAATTTDAKSIRMDDNASLQVVQPGRTLRPLSIVAKKEAREKEIRKNNEQHERRVRSMSAQS